MIQANSRRPTEQSPCSQPNPAQIGALMRAAVYNHGIEFSAALVPNDLRQIPSRLRHQKPTQFGHQGASRQHLGSAVYLNADGIEVQVSVCDFVRNPDAGSANGWDILRQSRTPVATKSKAV